jgi:hypothetical protein
MRNLSQIIKSCFTTASLCCALVLASCGSSSTAIHKATPTGVAKLTATTSIKTTPTAPTSELNAVFTSSDGLYTFKYPGSWSKSSINQGLVANGIALVSSDNQALMEILPFNQDDSATDYLLSFLQSAGAGDATLVSETAQSQTIGANSWSVYGAKGTLNDEEYEAAEFYLNHNGKAFMVITAAPSSSMDANGATYFEPMLESLKLLK